VPKFKHFSGDYFHRNAQKLEAIREWSNPGSPALLEIQERVAISTQEKIPPKKGFLSRPVLMSSLEEVESGESAQTLEAKRKREIKLDNMLDMKKHNSVVSDRYPTGN
jgi:hypothetical protein